MTERILGPTGSPKRRRRRRFLFLPVLLTAALGLFWIAGAQAVHDLDFELEGDIADSPVGDPFDWSSFFNSSGAQDPVLPSGSRPGFTASGFHQDFSRNPNGSYNRADPTTFATGSKDTLSISPGWQCNRDNNVNDKIDLTNAYAVTYVAPATIPGVVNAGDEILYFALERFANDGDANVAFWFLQGNVTCESQGGNTPFTGNHQDGDLLIVSAFTKGGEVSTIDVYRWNGEDNTGSLGTDSVASGVDCKDTLGGDSVCATTNDPTQSPIDPPWDTENKDGTGNLLVSEFYEGGLNLTEEGLGGRCFNTFLADTRSSQELTATLFDYASGTLGACGLEMTTTPSQTTRVIDSTDPITDTATVAGTTAGGGAGPTPTGTVSFFLCSPSQLTPANTGTCQGSSGAQVGSAVTVAESVPGTATATSANAASLITGIGKYCFRATFTAAADDPNYAGQTAETSNLANECFTVTGTAALATAQNWLPNDTATITGDANLNGTVTFTLYTGDNCGATSGAAVPGQVYTTTLTNATSPATASTANTTFKVVDATEGSYSWKVQYDDTTLQDPADSCEVSTLTIAD